VNADMRVGAVVLVTLAVGDMRWDSELCDVASMARVHGVLTARCVSVCSPSEEAWVPVNDRSIELVAPPVSGVAK
jgi:hypothetical protein